MKFERQLAPFLLLCLAVNLLASGVRAQNNKPSETRLLNGLRLLVIKDPGAKQLSLKLRINSGASFDTLGKEGTMDILSRALFPGEQLREFYREDLDGNFSVRCEYDYIQIDAAAKPDKLLEMLEPIAAGLLNPDLSKEATARVKPAALEAVRELDKNRGLAATMFAAKSLVGSFPYGRPKSGTPATVEKIDFADLIQAKERFLTSDNATLALRGNVDPAYVERVIKRLFGSWTKADRKVPATFAQPDSPRQTVINGELYQAIEGRSEVRAALRGFARSDSRFPALSVLELVLQERLKGRYGDEAAYVAIGHLLPSVIVFGGSTAIEGSTGDSPLSVLQADVTDDEFGRAKQAVASSAEVVDPLQSLLDAETYGLQSQAAEAARLNGVTLGDVQAVLSALRSSPAVTVALTAPKVQSKAK